ncbi:MAG: hypothetical protein RL404_1689 [Pseudomonadota bacterium]|jgi:urease accessory protein
MARAIHSESGTAIVDAAGPDHMLATLSLGFGRDGEATRLLKREHFGPLRVQKALYPEGPSVAHAIIVHPPGGVVGGDELRIDVTAGSGAAAVVSTPGAAKWYRANGRVSRQQLALRVSSDAALEWLPQETIFFNDADVQLDTRVELQGNARFIGCDILCFGRTASGERFDNGRIRQRLSIMRDGLPLWLEQGRLIGGSAQMRSPLGLAGHTVCANLVAVGVPLSSALMQSLRDRCTRVADGRGRFGATQMKSALLVRYLGDSSEVARHVMVGAWQLLRPALLAREGTELRIWNT